MKHVRIKKVITKKGRTMYYLGDGMWFGRVSTKGKTPQQIGFELFGEGNIINSFRYKYLYPLHKGIRRRLEKLAMDYPKDSSLFRRDQKWITNKGEVQGNA